MSIDTRKTPAQRREKAQRQAFVTASGKVAAGLALLPVQAWILMLFAGALHGIAAPVAAFGYGTAILIILGVDLVAVTTKKFRK